jgi:hypothetical protein
MFNLELPLSVDTDSSDFAIGAILHQTGEDNKTRPVYYHSRKLQPAELNYNIFKKELLAVVEALVA